MNFQIHFDNIFPINKTKKQKKEPKPKKKQSNCNTLYSPDCPTVQFFSYKRCRDNVNRANGFIFVPFSS